LQGHLRRAARGLTTNACAVLQGCRAHTRAPVLIAGSPSRAPRPHHRPPPRVAFPRPPRKEVDAQDNEEGLGVVVCVGEWWWWWPVVVGGGRRGVVVKKAHLLRARLRSLLLFARGPPPPFPREDKEEDQHEAGRDEEALGAECPSLPSLPRKGGGGPSASSSIVRAWVATGRPRRIAPHTLQPRPELRAFLAVVFALAISPCSCRAKFIVGPSRAKPTHRRG
jgi:hypothetical protein